MRKLMIKFASLVGISLIAFIANIAVAPDAMAVPAGSKGWCTVVGPGQEECYFPSAFDACARQHSAYAATQPFYGNAPYGFSWWNNVCRWRIGSGIIQPTLVQFKCLTSTPKPTAPWNCQLPPSNECKDNRGANGLGSTAHPIDLVSGAKRFAAVDFQTADATLSLARSYSSFLAAGSPTKLAAVPLGLANWRYDFQVELQIGDDWDVSRALTVVLPSGRGFSFKRQTDGSITTYTTK